jgi:hypothetical protein
MLRGRLQQPFSRISASRSDNSAAAIAASKWQNRVKLSPKLLSDVALTFFRELKSCGNGADAVKLLEEWTANGNLFLHRKKFNVYIFWNVYILHLRHNSVIYTLM